MAIKIDNKLSFLIEVKAIGLELKDNHVKQAVDYASNQGCEWVVLTNGIAWQLYRVLFKKPIDKQEVAKFNLMEVSARNEADMDTLYLLTREGFTKSALEEYRDRQDATSRFMLAAILLNSEPVLAPIRREIRRISERLVETIVGEQAEAAARKVLRCAEKSIRRDNDCATASSEAGNKSQEAPAAEPR